MADQEEDRLYSHSQPASRPGPAGSSRSSSASRPLHPSTSSYDYAYGTLPTSTPSSSEADDEQSVPGGLFSTRPDADADDRDDNYSVASSGFHPGPFSYAAAAMAPGGNFGHDFGAGEHYDDDDNNHSYRRLRRHRRGHSDAPPMTAYAGEDTRPTSRKEILGWYAYAFASETYVICGIASFIPILLESLARENGVLLSDHTTPCTASNAHASAASSAQVLSRASATGGDAQCVVTVLGFEINTASFAMYTFSTSVLLQALLVVSISCAADHGNYRKTLLLTFAATGSISVMLYLAVSARIYLLGALLAVVSNTSFGASFVLLNSFLPLLVRHHPSLLFSSDSDASEQDFDQPPPPPIELHDEEAEEEQEEEAEFHREDRQHPSSLDGMDDPTSALLRPRSSSPPPDDAAPQPPKRSHEELTSLELSLSTQISSKGIGIGYCAALFVQCAASAMIYFLHNTVWSQRVVLFFIGAWWAIFTIPAAVWLRPRPGPPLPATYGGPAATGGGGEDEVRTGRGVFGRVRSWLAYLIFAWASLFRTIRLAGRLVDIVLFLAGWFLLSDAIATTSSTAVLFAKTQLHMEVWALGLINVISTSTGVVGAFSWAYVSRRLNLKPLHTILACLALFELIPIYGLMGYLPFVRNWGVGGLQQPWEMYLLAAVYGLVLGGIGSYCRSLYGELIPPGSETAFYALYAITDKGSSVFGPAIVGAIIDASGDIRPAFWFLALLVGLPAPLLYFVNVERGKREGERLGLMLEGLRADETDDSDSSHTPRALLADYDDEEPIPGRGV